MVVAQLVRVQRREFGTPQTISKGRNWLRHYAARLLARRKEATVHAGSASMSATASISGAGMAWHNISADRPDRLDAIAANLDALRERVDRLATKQGDNIAALRRDVDATRRALHDHTTEQEAQRKAELRASIKLEGFGVALFLARVYSAWSEALPGSGPRH